MKAKTNTQELFFGMDKYPPKTHVGGADHYIIVDGMNIAYQAFYAYQRLSYKGKSVAILFGFLQILKSKIKRECWQPEKIIVVWDGEKSKRRLKWWPKYKHHREEKRNTKQHAKFHKQIERTQKLIYAVGIAQLKNPKVEGDDMMCLAVNYYSKLGRITIISGDHDMVQLVNRDIQVYHPIKGLIYSPGLCSTVFGVEAPYLVQLFALTGDTSDDIPGIKGFGIKTAERFLRTFGSIQNYLNNPKAEFAGVNDKANLKKVWKKNRKLMDLQWYVKKYHSLKDLVYYKNKKNPKFKDDLFIKICQKYNLRTLSTIEFKSWYKQIQNEHN